MSKGSPVPVPVAVPQPVHHQSVPFDVDDFTLHARTKLETLSFLLSQAAPEMETTPEFFHGLAWLLDDIRETLTTPDGEKGAA